MRIASVVAWALLLVSVARLETAANAADLEPLADTPYRLHVILNVEEHPLFTAVYRARLQREIRDSLHAALGDLAVVDAFDSQELESSSIQKLRRLHDVMRDVLSRGLERGFDGHNDIGTSKMHFVFIDYRDGTYFVRARQLDGPTGLVGPVVREASTYDRELVARKAALLIQQDFGAVAEIDRVSASSDSVNLILQAGNRQGPMGDWIGKGDILAVSRIHNEQDRQLGDRVEWALLQVTEDPSAGKCQARLLTRYKDPLTELPGTAGFRCIRLGTIEAPIRIRLIDQRTQDPLPSIRVTFGQQGFDEKSEEERSTDATGLAESKNPFHNIAFVQVFVGLTLKTRIPLEIVDRNRIVVCSLALSKGSDETVRLEQDSRRLIDRTNERLFIEQERFRDLNKLNGEQVEALKRTEAGQRELTSALDAVRVELSSLRDRARSLKLDLPRSTELDSQLAELEKMKTELERHATQLKKALESANDPRRAQLLTKLNHAQSLEAEAEFDQAIHAYDEAIREAPDPAAVQSYVVHLANLKAAWAVKSPAHQKARDFILTTWPKAASASDLADEMAEAVAVIAECRKVGDYLRPLVLLKTNIAHANRLAKRLTIVQAGSSSDNRDEAKRIISVEKDLEKLNAEAKAAAAPPKEK